MTKNTKANIGEASEKVVTLLHLKESECDWKVCNHILRMMWPCPVICQVLRMINILDPYYMKKLRQGLNMCCSTRLNSASN